VIEEFAVPGARLHTETHGSGPLLLLIHGGNGDSASFDGIVGPLAEHVTVLTYVRRGFVRSPLDVPPAGAGRIAADVEDAAALICAHGGEALVFGSSSGAIVALDLVTRHPDLVRVVVVHEPPILELLDDPGAWAARFAGIRARYEAEGLMPALAEFGTAVGLTRPAVPVGEPSPGRLAMMGRVPQNMGFWFEHEFESYPAYRPDVAALGAVADRIVPAVGRTSRETDAMPCRPNVRLAQRLGREIVEFPGGHIGYDEQPEEFAAELLRLLRAGR
jgi:pimeloyl-ACP methyl ester carboxylesterase